jgi:hypothetical protein
MSEIVKPSFAGQPQILTEPPEPDVEAGETGETDVEYPAVIASPTPAYNGGLLPGGPCGALEYPDDVGQAVEHAKPMAFVNPKQCDVCGVYREIAELPHGRCFIAVERGLQPAFPTSQRTQNQKIVKVAE